MAIPNDYVDRVYAGVLGKIIGVYLGRPFEGWSHERILAELSEVNYYVADKLGVPLVVTDDDISGTFTFIRALEDYGCSRDITAEQIGRTWMNYIIENKTILWWGGLGMSTEHTAFLRMKQGIPAPRSGSIELNGKTVAEQIGAQIFIDGWAMVAPGDPELATDLARKAASVSHDGEAIYAAQVVAAIESMAFVESDLNKLIDTALTFIPKDCLIAKMIADLRRWRQTESDWKKALKLLDADYGYDKYGGNCHVIPNHGVIILSLLYGDDSFQKSLMIANTSGWDTDCNSGNVGCIMGIKNGLEGIDNGPVWRGPIADRMYLPTADGGRCITDAATESLRICRLGEKLARNTGILPVPSDSAAALNRIKFHFLLPGSVRGFRADDSPDARNVAHVGQHAVPNEPSQNALQISAHRLAPGRVARVSTATFLPPEARSLPGYAAVGSPTLYPGQTVQAVLSLDSFMSRVRFSANKLLGIGNMPGKCHAAECRLYVSIYNAEELLSRVYGPSITLTQADEPHEIGWKIPDLDGAVIAEIGLEIRSETPARMLAVNLHYLTWSGPPNCTFKRPSTGGTMWQRAWVDSGQSLWWGHEPFRLISNEGRATLSTGTDDWDDYRVSTTIEPNLAKTFGLAARVRGLHRFYALLLDHDGTGKFTAKLIKSLDGDKILAQKSFPWQLNQKYKLDLQVVGPKLTAFINDQPLLEATDTDHPFLSGGIALVCEDGRLDAGPITVKPAP